MEIDLRDLDARLLGKMVDYGPSELAYAANREIKRRQTPRFDGPVLVNLSGRPYAFESPYDLAVGDRVEVATDLGRATGPVVGYGTGGWDPRLHGPLKCVIRVLS